MPTITNRAGRTPDIQRVVLPYLTWLLVIACVLLAWRWLSAVKDQLPTPWDLSAESPNLCSVLLAKHHVNLYAPSTYNEYPFVLTAYTPLYHYVVSLFPINEANPFFPGRVVSLAAFLGLALLIVLRGRSGFSRLAGLGLAIAFLGTWPVSVNSAYLKNDSLGILFAVAGMLLVARSKSGVLLTASALLAVAALATKQSFVAAGIATAVFLAVNDRRALGKYVLALALWGTLAAACAGCYFGNGFWFSIIQSQRQAFELSAGILVLRGFLEPLAAALMLAAAFVVGRQIYAAGLIRTLQMSPCSVFFVLTTLQCLLTCWKFGAYTNYVIEPVYAACLVLAEAGRAATSQDQWRKSTIVLACGLCLAGVSDLWIAEPGDYSLVDESTRANWADGMAEYRQLVADSGIERPHFVNVIGPLNMFAFGLEPTFNDPWLYHTLWDRHFLSPEPFLAALAQQKYDVVIALEGYGVDVGLLPVDQRIRAVIAEKYKLYAVSLRHCFYVRNNWDSGE